MDRDKQRWKRIERMHALRDRVAEWAAQRWPDELRDGIRDWLGPHEPEEDLVMQGIAFALIAPPDTGVSLLERYRRAVGRLPRLERAILDAWQQTWFCVSEIVAVEPGLGFRVEDVVTGEEVEVLERSASHQLDAGDWLASFLMPADGRVELEGTSMPLRDGTRIAAVQAFLRGMEERGLDAGSLDPASSRQLARAVIRAARQQQRSPCFLNYDRHPVELIEVTLDLDWGDVLEATRSWEDAVEGEDVVTLLGRHEPALSGPLVLASFLDDDGHRVVLNVNSRARLEHVFSLWESRVGSPLGVVEERVRSVDSDPDGPQLMMDSSYQEAESAEQAQADLLEDLASNWLDTAIPALDGLSPRQAVEAGRNAEVRALLPTRLGPAVVRDLRGELGV